MNSRVKIILVILNILTYSISAYSDKIEINNPFSCHPPIYGLSSYHQHSDGLRITFDPQDILRCQIPFKDSSKYNLPAGKYHLYVQVAPDGSKKKTNRTFEIGLGDIISPITYAPPKKPTWIGPIEFDTHIKADTIDLRGTERIKINSLYLLSENDNIPPILADAIPCLTYNQWQAAWLNWPQSHKHPMWITDGMQPSIQIRSSANPDVHGQANIMYEILDVQRQVVGKGVFKVEVNGLKPYCHNQKIPIPQKYGPYLIIFRVILPNGSEREYQRIVSRISQPLIFNSDRLGGHGNRQLLRRMGATWNRMWDHERRLLWTRLQPQKDVFLWPPDDVIETPPLKTLLVLEVSDGYPKWAGDRYENPDPWLEYVRAVVTRYKNRVPAYEIFNEPYFKPTDEFCKKQVELVNRTAALIRSIDPKAMIATGGPPEELRDGYKWWRKLAKAGLFKNVDIASAHLYVGGGGIRPLDQDMRFDAYVRKLRKLLDHNGAKGKPIWDTESGLCPNESYYLGRQDTYGFWNDGGLNRRQPVSYRTGIAMASRLLLLHFYHNIRWCVYHTITASGNSWAANDYDNTPLPFTVAIAQLTRLLDNATPDGIPRLPKGLWGVRFKLKNRYITAIWSVKLKPGEQRYIPFPDNNIQVLDVFCNPIERQKRLSIGITPVLFASRNKLNSSKIKVISEYNKKDIPSELIVCLTDNQDKYPVTLTSDSTREGYSLDSVRSMKTFSKKASKNIWNSKSNGKKHWLEYRWEKDVTIHRIRCAWPEDNMPIAYQIQWYDGRKWRPCRETHQPRKPKACLEEFPVREITTSGLRLVLRTKPNQPAAVSTFGAHYLPRITPPITEMQEVFSSDFRPTEKGYVSDWLICGPFPSPGTRYSNDRPTFWYRDFLKSHWIYGSGGGEIEIRPLPEVEHVAEFPSDSDISWRPMDVRVAWQPVHTPKKGNTEGRLNLAERFSNDILHDQNRITEQCYGYAYCLIKFPSDFTGKLSIGSDDGYQIWLDGKRIAEKIVFRGANPDQDAYDVHISKGEHRMLIKVHNDIGGHELYLRFLNSDGTPFKDYIVRMVP